MYKVTIDPITKQVLCITHVMANTPIYNTDILLNDDDVGAYSGIPTVYVKNKLSNEIVGDTCSDCIKELVEELSRTKIEDENSYFIDKILSGSSIDDVRKEIVEAKNQKR